MKHLLPLIMIIVATGGQRLPVEKTKRLPLQKKQVTLQSPREYLKRVLRVDAKTGEEILYDPKPRIALMEAKSGKYYLKWIGYDGKENVVVYQRPDAVDVVVSASAVKTRTGEYVYQYTVQNLGTSGEYLRGFEVQTFSSAIMPSTLPTMIDNILIGEMSTPPEWEKGSEKGRWIAFAPLSPRPRVSPGQSITFQLSSPSPPGLVMCRVDGGDRGMNGVGEHMPQELENALPNTYEICPSGYTIGPIDNLKKLSPAERAHYLLKLLPKFKELGWITADALRWYQQTLSGNDFGMVYERTQQDLKEGNITTEVFAMIQAIKE